ncbi:P-loop containing nucleoside triphosphate hydrolase protein [Phanerochaete sordida]|uniref:P-loop containing nucleoside triphosphate hydrolase protein n=1 Tax=Phanerochaete sordida TaxID=48140 RepID=A0A9P3GGI2_9APHY|nr:P-loop containing nucleoside triphosphate hydrolase protein [Phanerochaete sordida]
MFKASIPRCFPKKTANFSNPFNHHSVSRFLAAASTQQSLPRIEDRPPEIIIAGRANVGKSTLVNAVLGRTSLASTSKQGGHTKTLNFYGVGPVPHKLVLVDAPGYGARGRPEWGRLFQHYITHREELKRIYILINGEHGVKDVDIGMLQMLNSICETSLQSNRPITLQAIVTKTDTIRSNAPTNIQQLKQAVFEAAPLCLPPIVTAATKGRFFGKDDVRWNMIEACGLGRIASNVTHT